MNPSRKLTRRVMLIFLLLLGLCFGVTLYVGLALDNALFTWICAGFSVAVFMLFMVLVLLIRRTASDVLIQLSDVIDALIDLREDEVFTVLEDNMLSKLQAQTIKLTRQLRSQQQRLQADRDEIQSLISDIAHQLKTPLANLRMYGSLLQDEELEADERMAFMGNMESQVEKLSWLLDSLIKMSRLESGIIQLRMERGSLNDVLLTAVRQAYEAAQRKEIEIQFVAEQEIDLPFDSRWTAEAIFNLIDNAVKYTEKGGRIMIRTYRYEMFARIDIQDNGAGIAESEIPHLFQRFYRGKNSAGAEGVGIGLYLAREIITKQDGYIKVKSQPAEGSTFSVFLPLER